MGVSVSLDRISSPGAVLYLIAVRLLFAAAAAVSLPRPVASPPETLRCMRVEVQS
jgi:hypothetical protein